nr:integrase, catalytic region, zinc finger, CCHC-type, peptidase aspartic, catalytic [Tanacetum cinerariifolium]
MILKSVENGPLIWPSIEGNEVTRPNKYYELSATEAIQADCDYGSPYQSQQYLHNQSSIPLSITYPPNDFQSSVHHNVYSLSSSIPQVEYAPSVNQQLKFSQPNSGLIVPVFQKGNDHIDAINHMMSFLTAVITSRYPTTNNQLRNSSNLRQQATINNGRVTLQPIQERHTSLAAGTSRTYTPGASRNNYRKQMTVISYNCKGEGYMSKQCTKLKRKRDDSWFKDKVLLVKAQANGQILYEDELEFLADPRIVEAQPTQTVITHNVDYQVDDLDAYDSDCNEINTAKHSCVNDTLNVELERYKDQVRILKEGQNVDLKSKDNVLDLCAQSVEIDNLKQTLSEHLKEKESSMQTVTLLKNDFQKEESRNIDREIALEKHIKELNNIVFKRNQSAQTVHIDLNACWRESFQNASKQKDPMMSEKKVNTTPVDYANSMNSSEPTPSTRQMKVKVLKELTKVSMVNTSLKKLKHHLASFDVVVKERTTTTTITGGTWGFEHTKSCFRDEIIPFVKALNDLFNSFDQFLVDELSEVQSVFHQMEQAVEQHRVESKTFEVKMNKVLNENERLLEQVISKDIVNILVNSSGNNAYETMHAFDIQLNHELFQRDNSFSQQSAPSFDQLFAIIELNAQSQEKDMIIKKLKERIKSLGGNMKEDKIKKELEEIETINIELDHRVTKIIAENEHLKQTYKQLYDSIKSSLIRSKEQCDDLINQVNLKSAENSDLNASLQEKVLVIIALKENLRKLKGKVVVDEAVISHPIDPEMLKVDEEIETLREIVEQGRSLNPLNTSLDYAYSASVLHSKLNVNSDLQCVTCNGCLFSDNHDSRVLDYINNVNARVRSKSVKKRLKRNVWKPTEKVVQIVLWYLDSVCSKHMTGDRSQLTNFVDKFLGMVKFRNDRVAKIMGYGDYQIGNAVIVTPLFVKKTLG